MTQYKTTYFIWSEEQNSTKIMKPHKNHIHTQTHPTINLARNRVNEIHIIFITKTTQKIIIENLVCVFLNV